MSNFEKKIDALIDALGFDVETELDKESYNRESRSQQARGWYVTVQESDHCKYKLTKRKTNDSNRAPRSQSADEKLSEAVARMGQQ